MSKNSFDSDGYSLSKEIKGVLKVISQLTTATLIATGVLIGFGWLVTTTSGYVTLGVIIFIGLIAYPAWVLIEEVVGFIKKVAERLW